MVGESLPPRVEQCDEAEFTAKMSGIGTDGLQRLGDGIEQNGVDRRLVLVSDGRDLGGHREHHVEVGHLQKVRFAGREPFIARGALALSAMAVATTVIGDLTVLAVVACLDMTSECSGATQFDRRHDAPLDAAEMAVVGKAISMTMAAEDIRHLEYGTHRAA